MSCWPVCQSLWFKLFGSLICLVCILSHLHELSKYWSATCAVRQDLSPAPLQGMSSGVLVCKAPTPASFHATDHWLQPRQLREAVGDTWCAWSLCVALSTLGILSAAIYQTDTSQLVPSQLCFALAKLASVLHSERLLGCSCQPAAGLAAHRL